MRVSDLTPDIMERTAPLCPIRWPAHVRLICARTPMGQGEDMDSGELIDAKFPTDLMNGVQASPTEIKLVLRPKKKQAVGKKAAGATSSARSKTPAATAASAVSLGRTKSTRSKREVRSGGGGSSSGSSSAVGAQEPEIIVLD